MTYKIDFINDTVYEWTITEDGVEHTTVPDYTPTIFVATADQETLIGAKEFLRMHPDVVSVSMCHRQPGWRENSESVLRIAIRSIENVTEVAHEIRGWGEPGEYKLYNVDFSREFRYCLEQGIEPVPEVTPTACEITLPPKQLGDDEITGLQVDDERFTGSMQTVLDDLQSHLGETDPDILILSSAQLVPLLCEKAEQRGFSEFRLGRREGWQQLAEKSQYESYGRVGHSPARYNVPGRAIIDKENTFFWTQTNLDGLFDLVERSAKPLQETAWASIGNVLTAIQIREATRRDVLVPWNSWRHEKFKSMATLHDADRGGFIFSPDTGLHENIHEIDFSSLYPNIIRTRNISPEKIRCECHSDRADVPDLGYSICDEPGYLPDVLKPIIQDREEYKATIRQTEDPEREAELRGRSEALKWILVSCFGYQGFSNAKFGRIECHEAINAFAREILLDSKESLEANGWRVIHGIVDSLWVQARPDTDQTPLDEVCEHLTEEIGIKLDYEAHYDWIAFVPRVDSEAGALNRYFAKYSDEDDFKTRGIEVRQRSTPAFIETCQMELLQTLDNHRTPQAVCDRLARQIDALQAGDVEPEELLIKKRVSKQVDEYSQYTQNVAALDRADTIDFTVNPGESVRYLVVDDEKDSQDRVKLEFETLDAYDTDYYTTLLVRAAESVLAPLGWRRDRIRQYLSETRDASLAAYTSSL